jgi:class 3 adenylate cyclase
MAFSQRSTDRGALFDVRLLWKPPQNKSDCHCAAGIHTGEIEIRGRDIGGIAVHAAARVMAQSNADEVLVSRVVNDLVAGSGLKFSDRGSHKLKGLPGKWDLFAASL